MELTKINGGIVMKKLFFILIFTFVLTILGIKSALARPKWDFTRLQFGTTNHFYTYSGYIENDNIPYSEQKPLLRVDISSCADVLRIMGPAVRWGSNYGIWNSGEAYEKRIIIYFSGSCPNGIISGMTEDNLKVSEPPVKKVISIPFQKVAAGIIMDYRETYKFSDKLSCHENYEGSNVSLSCGGLKFSYQMTDETDALNPLTNDWVMQGSLFNRMLEHRLLNLLKGTSYSSDISGDLSVAFINFITPKNISSPFWVAEIVNDMVANGRLKYFNMLTELYAEHIIKENQ